MCVCARGCASLCVCVCVCACCIGCFLPAVVVMAAAVVDVMAIE